MAQFGLYTTRELKPRILDLLKSMDFESGLRELASLPPRKVINSILSFFYHDEELVRWRSITAAGVVVQKLAIENREAARVIIRRLMWSLNDESGGIGWGAPEAMGEIIARDEKMANEYAPILVSYMDENGNFLEFPPLQRGLMWALVRVAQVRPDSVKMAASHIVEYLKSADPQVRGPAALAAGLLRAERARAYIEALCNDNAQFMMYFDGIVSFHKVSEAADQALALLDAQNDS